DAESPHCDVIDALDTRLQLVPPGDVVGGAGREDFDLGVPREVLGNVPGMQLRAAVDRLPVPLNDDRQLHCASSGVWERGAAGAPASAAGSCTVRSDGCVSAPNVCWKGSGRVA